MKLRFIIFVAVLSLPMTERQTNAAEEPKERASVNADTDALDAPTTKLPIPDEAAQKESSALIQEVYKADYDKAKSPMQKLELAKKLLQEGKQTDGDATGKFVLLRIAKDIATQAGDPTVALQAIDLMSASYEVDPLELKIESLTKLSKLALAVPAQKELVEALDRLADSAAEKDNYVAAQRVAGLAITASRSAKDASLLKRAVARSKEIELNSVAFAETQKAIKVLDEKPTDPNANLVVGRFRCFNRRDWDHGLPLLTLGNDAILKGLAEKEANQPSKASDQVALGDAWWSVADKEAGVAKAAVRSRAVFWYEKAMPSLTGLPKARIAKRLSEMQPPGRSAPSAINLIDKLKETQGSDSDKWTLTDEGIVLGKRNQTGGGLIDFGYGPSTEYDLRVTFTKTGDAVTKGFADLIFVLPDKERTLSLNVRQFVDGTALLGFWPTGGPGERFAEGRFGTSLVGGLPKGSKHVFQIEVRQNSIKVLSGGKLIYSLNDLAGIKSVESRERIEMQFFPSSSVCGVTINSIEAEPLSR